MNLINKDSICIAKYTTTGDTNYDQGFDDGVAHAFESIRETPTIDAIPVEWLEQTKENYIAVATVLKMWQKEQEAR